MVKLPPLILAALVIVPVELTIPAVVKLPPVMLAVALTVNPCTVLADVIVEVTEINPPVRTLPPVILPAVTAPVVLMVFDPNAAKKVDTFELV